MNIGEYDYEPTPGLAYELRPGESLLWQGRPEWWPLARRAMRVVPVAAYFALLAGWRGAVVLADGQGALAALRNASLLLLLGALVCGLLCTLAWLAARATMYSITSARVVIRHGIALPMSLNLPLTRVHAAALGTHADGTGDIALELARGERIGYFLAWPHVRPFHFLQPQPSLRALAGATRAAEALERALQESVAAPRSHATTEQAPLAGAPRTAAVA
jgi:hypothetical protein